MLVTDLATPSVIRKMLAEHGLVPNKALGQNFIADKNHLSKIVAAAEPNEQDGILEIGPGTGALTVEMASRCRQVISIEIDKGLVNLLMTTCAGLPNVRIVHADAMKVDLGELLRELSSQEGTITGGDGSGDRRAKVVANLPYYITTPLLFQLLPLRRWIQSMVLLVQKEVAQRMSAQPGDDKYGALTVAIRYSCDVRLVGTVPPSAFYPAPDVTSAIVRLDVLQKPRVEVDETQFFDVVRAAFGQRRKNLLNTLSSLAPKEQVAAILDKAGVDWRRRGETLGIREFASIARSIGSLQKRIPDARLDTNGS